MNYGTNKYKLIIKYDEERKEVIEDITGFEDNSDIIYHEPNKFNNGYNGSNRDHYSKGIIEFYLKKNSVSIKSLLRFERGQYLLDIEIVDRNNINIEVKGTSFKINSRQDNTHWTIEEFSESEKVAI